MPEYPPEAMERRVRHIIAIAVGSALGGLCAFVMSLRLVRRFWREHKARNAIRAEIRKDEQIHKINAARAREMLLKAGKTSRGLY